jgi:hypothetical protein
MVNIYRNFLRAKELKKKKECGVGRETFPITSFFGWNTGLVLYIGTVR